MAKLVYQTGRPVQRTDYLGPYQYEADSLRFFPHAEGRVLRVANTTSGAVRYEREFTFKDHLGNLRLAYRAGQRHRYEATLEQDAATHARESQQFDSLSVSSPVAQAVGSLARTGAYAARLNAGGSTPHPLGPLTQFAVQKGDTLFVTAPGRYQQATGNTSFAFSLAGFVASLLNPAPGQPAGLDGSRRGGLPLLQVGLSSATLLGLTQLPGGVPKGYLRVLSFSEDSVLVDQRTVQLTAAALGNYETLSTGQLIVQQNGYVSVYVGNESAGDVYFDDVTIEHRQGLQVQENQYDPFGLDLAGVSGAAPGLRLKNFYQFNGKENQLDLGLNWNHQDWRFFDYQLGRWHAVDPLLETGQESWTPYSFSYNNAIRFSDPKGQFPGLGELYDKAKSGLNRMKENVVGFFIEHTVDEKDNSPTMQAFAEKNTIAGARAHLIGKEARRISDGAQVPTQNGTGDGSPVNALRHGMLSAMLTNALGVETAEQVTDAHEAEGQNVLQENSVNVQELKRTGKTVLTSEGELADHFVDQLNNSAGRRIATANPGASNAKLQNLALDALQGGNPALPRLYIMAPGPKEGTVTIIPASLSSEAASQARSNMTEARVAK